MLLGFVVLYFQNCHLMNYIENIAVIKKLDIDFSAGFTALTGETGAGKTLIIDALTILSGGRFSKEMIRYGQKNSYVENGNLRISAIKENYNGSKYTSARLTTKNKRHKHRSKNTTRKKSRRQHRRQQR